MADEAKRTGRRSTGRQRLLLWTVVLFVITVVAGWLDARAGVRYFHNFNGERYRGPHKILIEPTLNSFELKAALPETVKLSGQDVLLRCDYVDEIRGLLFTVHRDGLRSLRAGLCGPGWARGHGYSDAETEELRQLLYEYAQAHPNEFGGPEFAERLRLPDGDIDEIVWLGIIGNGIFYSVFVTPVLLGLCWYYGATFGTRRERCLGRGRCPRCRYQIRDLPENRCPECGETWSDDETSPASEGEA